MSDLWKLVEQGQKAQQSQFGMVNAMSQLQKMGTDARVRGAMQGVNMGDPASLTAKANELATVDPEAAMNLQRMSANMLPEQRQQAILQNKKIIAIGQRVLAMPESERPAAYEDGINELVASGFKEAERFRGRVNDLPMFMALSRTALETFGKPPEVKPFRVGGKEVPHFYNDVSGKFEPVPGVEGIDPMEKEPLYKVLGPDGVTYRRRGDAVDKAAPEDAKVVMGPDGKIIYAEGRAARTAASGMSQATQNKAEEALFNATGTRQQLADIAGRFKPEFQQIPTKLGMEWTALKDKGGGLIGKASPQDKAALDEFTQYRASAATLFASILKEQSGVAVNPTEFKRAEAYLPNPGSGIFDGDSPTELKSKVERFTDFNDKAIARLSYVTKNGLSINDIPLDDMPRIINERGREIEAAFKGRGLEGEGLRNAVRDRLAREFGLAR